MAALHRLAILANGVRRRQQLGWQDNHATWVLPAPTLTETIVLNTLTLLASPDSVNRIEACKECRWLFLDTTRNHSRRYCDPADCSNRARQRRYAARN